MTRTAPPRLPPSGLVVCLTGVVASAAVAKPLYPAMRPPFTTWIDDGAANVDLVAPPPGRGTDPAQELNRWLNRITGVTLPVSRTKSARRPAVFVGGPAAWRRLGVVPGDLSLGREGYVIRSVGQDLVITGATHVATLYGVDAFVEHYLGCRWFWPGPLGRVVPKQKTLRVGRIDEVSVPDFAVRWVIRDNECARFNGGNVALAEPDDFRFRWFVHTYLRLVEPGRYWVSHPEFYADRGGQRPDPTAPRAQVNLCTCNPEVIAAAARRIDSLARADPSLAMVSVDPMDTQQFCRCSRCRKWQSSGAPYEQRHSDLVFAFTNGVAELTARSHPHLLLKTIAYQTYLAPPRFPVRDNVVVQFCRFMCHNHPLAPPNCPESAYFNRQLVAWRRKCKRVMLYEYYYKASWCGLPWPIVHTLRRDVPYLKSLGVFGVASQWNRNDANNGLVYYVASKLLWNSELEVEALVDDFCTKAYAEAATPMGEYHRHLEKAMEESGLHVATQRGYQVMHEFLSPELEARLAADLSRAGKVVRDPQAARRVALADRGFEYARLVARYLEVVAARMEKKATAQWLGAQTAADLAELESACRPAVAKIRAFLTAKGNTGLPTLGQYEALLLSPKNVAANWFNVTDRPEGIRLTKPRWLKRHPQRLPKTYPTVASLWIYGNDLDWTPETGAEHNVVVEAKDGTPVRVGRMGRADRVGDGRNLLFIIRHVPLDRLAVDPLDVTIENPPGGPYASRVFAVYLMPDDQTTEDEAQGLLERRIELVRRRSLGFVEFGFSGVRSTEGEPAHVSLTVCGLPQEPRSPVPAADGR